MPSSQYKKKKGLKITPGKRVWDRLEGETERAFQAFVVYRDSASPRIIADTILPNGQTVKRATLYSWSKSYDWASRAKKFDDWKENQVFNKKAIVLSKQTSNAKLTQYENVATKLRFFLDLAGDILVEKLTSDPAWIDNKLSFKDIIAGQEKLVSMDKSVYGEDYFRNGNSIGGINLKKLTLEEKEELKRLMNKASEESDEPELEENEPPADE